MELINPQADVREFIEFNDTNCLPPYKFEFIPYVSDISEKPSDGSGSGISSSKFFLFFNLSLFLLKFYNKIFSCVF